MQPHLVNNLQANSEYEVRLVVRGLEAEPVVSTFTTLQKPTSIKVAISKVDINSATFSGG